MKEDLIETVGKTVLLFLRDKKQARSLFSSIGLQKWDRKNAGKIGGKQNRAFLERLNNDIHLQEIEDSGETNCEMGKIFHAGGC